MDQATNKIIPKVAPKAARGAMAGLALSALLGALGISAANIALPALAETFGATFARIQWVVLICLLAVTTVIVGVGQLGDIHGRRRVLTGGIVMFTVASAACAAALAVIGQRRRAEARTAGKIGKSGAARGRTPCKARPVSR